MADNIKTFSSSIDQLRPTSQGEEAFQLEGRHVEAAYTAAGQEFGQPIERYQTMTETADVMKQLSDLEVQKTQDLETARTTMDPHDPNAAANFIGKYDDALSKLTDNIGMPAVREMAQKQAQEFRTRGTISFIDMQSKAAAADTLGKVETSADNYAKLGNQDPTTVSTGIAAVNTMAATLPVEQRPGFIKQHAAAIYDSTAEGIVGRVEGQKIYDPVAVQNAKDYINDPKNGFVGSQTAPGMSDAKFAEVNNRLDNARRNGANASIDGMELNFPAMQTIVKNTGQPPADLLAGIQQLKAVGTPAAIAAAAKAEQGIADGRGFYQANQAVIKTPASGVQKLLDDAKSARDTAATGPEASINLSRYDQVVAAVTARHEAFYGNNPVAQAQWAHDSNPGVATAYAAFQANPTPDTFYKYAQMSSSYQKFLEPGRVPSVLTNDMKQNAQEAINEIDRNPDPKVGPQTAVQKFGGMANLYGTMWPQIAGDLKKAGVFNGLQVIMADLSSRPSAAGYLEPLARASVSDEKALENFHQVKKEDARTAVRGEMEDLVGSMGNINNAPDILESYVDAASKVMQITGKADAYSTVQAMFLDKFQFTGSNKTIRVPRGAGLDADAIGHGSENVLSAIDKHDLVIPPSAGSLGSINQKAAWIDAIKQNGVWFTKADGTGATLHDGSATGNPVMETINGHQVPVTLNWAELQRLGKVNEISEQQQNDREAMAQRQAGH